MTFIDRLKRKFQPNLPNTHMPARTAELRSIDSIISAYLRPSFSDFARLQEYRSAIYVPENHLTDAVRRLRPRYLVDVGANIGLSTVSLIKNFPTLEQIAGVEAEHENYQTLTLNYNYWKKNLNIGGVVRRLLPVYAIASSNPRQDFAIKPKRLKGGVSASGTFQFVKQPLSPETPGPNNEMSGTENEIEFSGIKVTIEEVLRERLGKAQEEAVIVKVDIEGGEEDLFSGPCDWMREAAFITIEIHDYMGALYSSRPLIQKLFEYDFAIIPRDDVLHCYNRSLLSLT